MLSVATLYEEANVSPIWLEVVERSTKFLRQVVTGDVISGRQYCTVPLEDQHTSLNILLELAIQKGTLGSILEMVLLLLHLWNKATHLEDNRSLPKNATAPILPFLKRFENVQSSPSILKREDNEETYNCMKMFLKFLTMPDDDECEIDLKQSAILLLAHLDRLASPHLPSQLFNKTSTSIVTNNQQVWSWGWLSWVSGFKPQTCDAISELNISQMCCSDRSVLILTSIGRVYFMYFYSESPSPQLVEGLKEKEVIKIACHTESKHFLALTKNFEVYSWGSGDGSRLGLLMKSFTCIP